MPIPTTTAETSYSRQGEEQPFGYTGYRYDDISSTYFAQAREYQPKTGRFTAEDKIKGYFTVPESLNQYSYCKNSPLKLIDKSGLDGYYFYDPEMYFGVNSEGEEIGVDIEKIKEMDIAYLEKKYNTTIHPIAMDPSTNPDYTTFEQAWADMDDSQEEIEVVVIVTHANDNHFATDSEFDSDNIRYTSASVDREGIGNLECKDIATLYLFGCNMGLTDRTDRDNNSLASEFYASGHNIDEIIATDGSIVHGRKGNQRILYVQPGQYHKDGKEPEGFKRYTFERGKLQTEVIDIRKIWDGLYEKEYSASGEVCTEKKKGIKK